LRRRTIKISRRLGARSIVLRSLITRFVMGTYLSFSVARGRAIIALCFCRKKYRRTFRSFYLHVPGRRLFRQSKRNYASACSLVRYTRFNRIQTFAISRFFQFRPRYTYVIGKCVTVIFLRAVQRRVRPSIRSSNSVSVSVFGFRVRCPGGDDDRRYSSHASRALPG